MFSGGRILLRVYPIRSSKTALFKVPEKLGLGFDGLNEEVIEEHINPNIPGYFELTDEWNTELSNDRIWS